MNLLTSEAATEPAGAAALLGLADPDELARFRFLEDRVWDSTTLPAPVIEAVRIRSARVRGCAFCASVRTSGAMDAGLSEEQLSAQDSPESRALLPADHQAALRLVDAFLIDGATPPADETAWLVEVLGPEGVVEVLVACSVFSSADLRIALGDNRAANRPTIERAHTSRPRAASAGDWPALETSIMPPEASIPHLDPGLDAALSAFRADIFGQADIPTALFSACLVRCAQLLRAPEGSELDALLAPVQLRSGVAASDVADWTRHLEGVDRHVMAYAEQLWLDPSGLDEPSVTPLRSTLGDPALIRLTWHLIWIGQFQRLSAVLGPAGAA